MSILEILKEEKKNHIKGRLYHYIQVNLAYNTNRIEGSKLSEDQTRYIYETNTFLNENGKESANVDDIVETVNHFTCFDYMLNIAEEQLTEKHIKEFHQILKRGTSDSRKEWFNVGEYKGKPNMVGGRETVSPEKVNDEMVTLLKNYHEKELITVEDIIAFHVAFEKIHPFQDGNGRVGRLIMFKECLKHNIVPFIIEDENKGYYYRGLSEYEKTKGFLIDTCLASQDKLKDVLNYFEIKY